MAVCAQHRIVANIGVAVSVSHVTCPISALPYAPTLFLMTTISALPFIVLSGLNRGNRVGTMHSLYPPWDPRSKNMQRWGAGDNHNIRIVIDARHVFYYMGWHDTDPGSLLSEAGVCMPDALPMSSFCKNGNRIGCKHCSNSAYCYEPRAI